MFPVLFEHGILHVYSYGALIALGGGLSAAFLLRRRREMGLADEGQLWTLLHCVLAGGFLGGRVLHLIEYAPRRGAAFWSAAFSLSTGFSVLGAFVGVTLGIWGFSRWRKVGALRLLDYICQVAPFWHFLGRLGCFAAGCCYGKPADVFWAVAFTDPRAGVPPEWMGRPLHPTQLYEGFGDLAIACALYCLVLPRVERGRLARGSVCAAYFLLYGALRFVVEFYRGDTVAFAMGLTAAQAGSLGLAAAGVGALLTSRHRRAARC